MRDEEADIKKIAAPADPLAVAVAPSLEALRFLDRRGQAGSGEAVGRAVRG